MDKKRFQEVWLEYEEFSEPLTDEEMYNDICNVMVTLSDGRRYAFNVWTFKFLERAISDCKVTGEHLSGLYLPPPDLLVQRLDRATIEQSLNHWFDLDSKFPDHLEQDDPL